MFVGRCRLKACLPLSAGIYPAPERRVSAFVFLIIGLGCAIISRILLTIAACQVSVGWALGVWLPFGPLLFRLSYPDSARSSMLFRFATLPCLFLYFVLGPGPSYRHQLWQGTQTGTAPGRYALETGNQKGKKSKSSNPAVDRQPSIEERRMENFREFQRLQAWSEALKLRKRDLLHSDTEGNRAYEIELVQYNAALAKANAEKDALARLK
jgi:hypothetical protein